MGEAGRIAVSFLDRFSSNGHLSDDRLAAIWTDASLSGGAPADPHLHACAACRSRFNAFSGWLEQIRADEIADADEAFPPERLAAQEAQIFRRIEAAERPARVIAFPKFARPITSGRSHVHRWVAAAAAAAFIVGMAVGQLMDLRHSFGEGRAVRTLAVNAQPSTATPNAVQPASLTLSDDALMVRIEEASTPQIPDSLVALDSMTPRARDLVNRTR
jgi:hypothetical protein